MVAGTVPLMRAVPLDATTAGAVWLATAVPLFAMITGADVTEAAAAEVAFAMAELAAEGVSARPTTYDLTSVGRPAIQEGVELAANSDATEE